MCHVEKTKDHKTCQMKCSSLKNCPSFYVDGHSEEKATNVALRESHATFKVIFLERKKELFEDEKKLKEALLKD